ncbi:starch synthase [Priestia taiwanensis]|uniref:Glycogen synthase n=1 Tax=Priestia taiwanensis TaxID=1347902 RepID=A0A917AW22_9BACI|nr:glycogen synthase GlgA [Priestia taiwanensis]MBM7363317.1 starch synthase [Priestia taiwanensis]GGE78147.1 glycogen synthase [Priestia taiwanensis]
MKVLFAVSECVPFAKSGGLADVAGALPKELKKLGTEVRVILPNYSSISPALREEFELYHIFQVKLGWRNQYCGIFKTEYDGVTYYLLDNEYYFKRDSLLYGHYDDGERFSFFSRAVLDSIPFLDFMPDVLHCHDWHTGMVSFLLDAHYREHEIYKDMKTVFTIHNLQFQGVFPKDMMHEVLELDEKYFNMEQLEFYGKINFMKAGIAASDLITTVSPTYKEEIQYAYFGEKLDGLLRKHNDKLYGIVNGIDDTVYNPVSDQEITSTYDAISIERKHPNKVTIQQKFGLQASKDTPIIAMVTRLTKQKGLDLVRHVFHQLMEEEIQLIVLGTGEKEYEDFFKHMEYVYPEKVRAYIGFNESLAHELYAGADLFLMPSQFEPCGLGQLIALQYGTVPIVRETGGLNDTVQSYNEVTREGNGFSFRNFNAHDMLHTIKRALYYYHEPVRWEEIVREAMSRDYSWRQSAGEYNNLYRQLQGE